MYIGKRFTYYLYEYIRLLLRTPQATPDYWNGIILAILLIGYQIE